MGNRYFAATAMGGRLYLDGAEVLTYCNESVADMLVTRVGHRKACTIEDLLKVVRESERGLPAIRVWISEGLEGVARRLVSGLWDDGDRHCSDKKCGSLPSCTLPLSFMDTLKEKKNI